VEVTPLRRSHTPLLPSLAILALAAIWGYNWVVMKVGLADSGPFAFAALRALLGAFALFAAMIALRRPLRPAAIGGAALVGLLQTTGFMAFSTWALTFGGAGKVVVLAYTMPLWVLLMAWPVLGERIGTAQWIAIGLALLGLITIVDQRRLGFQNVAADGLAILSGLAWAGGTVAAKRLRTVASIDTLSLTAWQMLLGSIPLAVIALAVPEHPVAWTPRFVGALLYSAIAGGALAFCLWFYAVSRLPAGTAGIGSLLTPIIGITAAWLQLGEIPSQHELVGMVLVVTAIALTVAGGLFAPRRAAVPET